jgi:O-antigen biosynthesis protein
MKISVIVTNWNGLPLLKKNLPQIIEMSPEAQEIIIADDCSEKDESVKYLKTLQKKYSKLRLIANKKNLGFGKTSNNAVFKSIGDLVVLLNNDIYPHKNYIKNSLYHFSDPNVFGVGFAEEGHENWARIFWKNGYLQHEPGLSNQKTHISGWVSGGSSIIKKSLFEKLGGFDAIYQPFYSEDLDLGFRAWKSGYTLLWEPKSIVEHKHESTISKFSVNFLNYVKERNRLLNTWRNITDPKLLYKNKIALIGRVLSGPNYIKIIRAAKRQINKSNPPIVFPKLTDQEIFAKFSL